MHVTISPNYLVSSDILDCPPQLDCLSSRNMNSGSPLCACSSCRVSTSSAFTASSIAQVQEYSIPCSALAHWIISFWLVDSPHPYVQHASLAYWTIIEQLTIRYKNYIILVRAYVSSFEIFTPIYWPQTSKHPSYRSDQRPYPTFLIRIMDLNPYDIIVRRISLLFANKSDLDWEIHP